MGLKMGQYIKTNGFDGFDIEILFMGIKDGVEGNEPKVSRKDLQIAFEKMKKIQKEKTKKEAAENLAKGQKFLAENGKRKEVITTKSGLQIEILKKGDGKKPKATDRVKTHYRGTLIDGTEFDSSYARKQPITFALNRVIKGWTEGLQMINVGGKCKLYIPADLAYGARDTGKIPANSTLIFEIELLEAIDGAKPVKSNKKKAMASKKAAEQAAKRRKEEQLKKQKEAAQAKKKD